MDYSNYPATAYIIVGILLLMVIAGIPDEIQDYKVRRYLRKKRKERK
jgi:hypothetical protein